MKLALPGLFAVAIVLPVAVVAASPTGGTEAEHRAWQQQRLARLTTPDGWLTLIGLHFLKDGANTVGSAPGNDIVLAAGPARVGVVHLNADGVVTLEAAAGAGVRIDGREVARANLAWGTAATKVTCGSVTFFVIERSSRKALRVRDSESPRRRGFRGLDYFAYDPGWRITARWVPAAAGSTVPVTNVLGQVSPEPVAGRAVFERGGATVELLAIGEGTVGPLFFVFADATSGRETYGGGRFLYADHPSGDQVVLDFNRAENPPCAFTPHATCPLPPKQNRLSLAVTAGEKSYAGHD